MKVKFKKGQLVRRKNQGHNLYIVLDVKHPKMIVYCIESQIDDIQGQNLEVAQDKFEKVTTKVR
tara:strand:+ start:559 stop:750 length:192 start_codon:yes stop_codon:yes gene_type:complete